MIYSYTINNKKETIKCGITQDLSATLDELQQQDFFDELTGFRWKKHWTESGARMECKRLIDRYEPIYNLSAEVTIDSHELIVSRNDLKVHESDIEGPWIISYKNYKGSFNDFDCADEYKIKLIKKDLCISSINAL